MSGGSMDYLYFKVREADFQDNTLLRKAFRLHLNKVADALRAIEWNDSGDGDREEDEKIRRCLSDTESLVETIRDLKIELAELELKVAGIYENKGIKK